MPPPFLLTVLYQNEQSLQHEDCMRWNSEVLMSVCVASD